MALDPARGEDRSGGSGDPGTTTRRSPARAAAYGALGVVVVAAPTIWVATTDSNFAVPRAATEQGDDVVGVWRVLMTMATAIAALVVLLLSIAVISGARRRVASQSKGSTPLEVAYTAGPVVLVAAIFGVSVWLGERIEAATDGPDDLVIETEGFRWGWRFAYPGGPVVTGTSADPQPVVVLPVDRTVTFVLRSPDVIHSFYVPSFVTKLDVIPGEENRLTVRTEETGEFRGHCAEYCGLDHARMNFRVSIVDAQAFDAWIAAERDRQAAER